MATAEVGKEKAIAREVVTLSKTTRRTFAFASSDEDADIPVIYVKQKAFGKNRPKDGEEFDIIFRRRRNGG